MRSKTLTMGTLPIWPGLDQSERLQRRAEESRRMTDSMMTKQVLRELENHRSSRKRMGTA